MAHRLSLFIALLSVVFNLQAQSQTDVNVSTGGRGLVRTNISLSYDHIWGRVTDGFGARVSYEFLSRKQVSLSANFRYNSVTTDFILSDTDNGIDPDGIGLNGTHTMEQLGITATGRTTIFGKPLAGIGVINSEWGKGGFNRISATLMAVVMLRTNRATQFGIGLLGMINTTSKIPVFPIFFYRHKFNDRLGINLSGGQLSLDYTPTADDFISCGADINVKAFYFRPHNDGLPRTCRYTQTDFRPMVRYRRRMIENLYLEVQGGCTVNMVSRVNGKNGTRTYIELSQKPHPFIQIACSYAL